VSALPDVVIVGAAESENVGVVPDQSQFQLAADSVLRALAQCGLGAGDVDGVASTLQVAQFAHHLGTRPRWLDGTGVGGCSYMLHVRHAVAAIQTGQADVVVVAHGESGRSRVGPTLRVPDMASPGGQFELTYGVAGTSPPSPSRPRPTCTSTGWGRRRWPRCRRPSRRGPRRTPGRSAASR
jgi:acetyl-CoA acetyltransferase